MEYPLEFISKIALFCWNDLHVVSGPPSPQAGCKKKINCSCYCTADSSRTKDTLDSGC
jgi:hypothetical protein